MPKDVAPATNKKLCAVIMNCRMTAQKYPARFLASNGNLAQLRNSN